MADKNTARFTLNNVVAEFGDGKTKATVTIAEISCEANGQAAKSVVDLLLEMTKLQQKR